MTRALLAFLAVAWIAISAAAPSSAYAGIPAFNPVYNPVYDVTQGGARGRRHSTGVVNAVGTTWKLSTVGSGSWVATFTGTVSAECIGYGAQGATGVQAGGGGDYAIKNAISVTSGTSYPDYIAAGGSGVQTYFDSASIVAAGNAQAGIASVGDTTYGGGYGASTTPGGGGGGAAGPHGAGNNGAPGASGNYGAGGAGDAGYGGAAGGGAGAEWIDSSGNHYGSGGGGYGSGGGGGQYGGGGSNHSGAGGQGVCRVVRTS